MEKIAIYHMTNNPKRKSCIPLEMNILRKYAEKQGWEVVKEYVDLAITQGKKEELFKAVDEAEDFDILLIKYGYYISRTTESFIKLIKQFHDKNTKVYSITEGWL